MTVGGGVGQSGWQTHCASAAGHDRRGEEEPGRITEPFSALLTGGGKEAKKKKLGDDVIVYPSPLWQREREPTSLHQRGSRKHCPSSLLAHHPRPTRRRDLKREGGEGGGRRGRRGEESWVEDGFVLLRMLGSRVLTRPPFLPLT